MEARFSSRSPRKWTSSQHQQKREAFWASRPRKKWFFMFLVAQSSTGSGDEPTEKTKKPIEDWEASFYWKKHGSLLNQKHIRIMNIFDELTKSMAEGPKVSPRRHPLTTSRKREWWVSSTGGPASITSRSDRKIELDLQDFSSLDNLENIFARHRTKKHRHLFVTTIFRFNDARVLCRSHYIYAYYEIFIRYENYAGYIIILDKNLKSVVPAFNRMRKREYRVCFADLTSPFDFIRQLLAQIELSPLIPNAKGLLPFNIFDFEWAQKKRQKFLIAEKFPEQAGVIELSNPSKPDVGVFVISTLNISGTISLIDRKWISRSTDKLSLFIKAQNVTNLVWTVLVSGEPWLCKNNRRNIRNIFMAKAFRGGAVLNAASWIRENARLFAIEAETHGKALREKNLEWQLPTPICIYDLINDKGKIVAENIFPSKLSAAYFLGTSEQHITDLINSGKACFFTEEEIKNYFPPIFYAETAKRFSNIFEAFWHYAARGYSWEDVQTFIVKGYLCYERDLKTQNSFEDESSSEDESA